MQTRTIPTTIIRLKPLKLLVNQTINTKKKNYLKFVSNWTETQSYFI